MKKSILIILLSIVFFSKSYAQDTPISQDTLAQDVLITEDTLRVWTYGVSSSFNFAQVSLRNWVGGGVSSISINTLQSLYLNMEREKLNWNNTLEAGFGVLRQGPAEEAEFRKSDDRLIFISKASRQVIGKWMFTGMVDLRTQLAAGYEYKVVNGVEQKMYISDFLAPGFLISSIGWEYRKNENIFVTIAPISTKMTLVLHERFAQEGRFGVDPGRKFRIEYGAFFNSRYKKRIWENITLDTRLNLFANYENLNSIDVNWELLFLMKVNKYVTTSVSTQLIYDDDVDILRQDGTTGPATQLKTVLNVGLVFTFDRL